MDAAPDRRSRPRLPPALASMALLAATLAAATPSVQDVARLGVVNGQALACGAKEISARARQLMIDYAPRTGEYGAAFEQATQQAFRDQLESRQACPPDGVLALRVEQGAAALRGPDAPAQQAAPRSEINPRYLMIDTHGRMVANDDFPGRYQLLTFGYTYCPDVCPTTLAGMVQVRKRLGALGERLQLVFITVDPERDDPVTLDKYVNYFDPGIIALSGPAELTHAIADHFQVEFRKFATPGEPAGRYSVDHTAGMYLLGPDGGFIAKLAFGTPVDQLVEKLRPLLAGR